jgi:hypothetical protein
MYFVAMTIQVSFDHPRAPLTVADGVYAHAAILRAISDVDARAGQALHDMRIHKRITIAIVAGDRRGATLRLTFMSAEGIGLATTLMSAMAVRPTLRLGGTTCEVTALSLDDPRWCGVATWADLLTKARGPRVQITFVTPTAVMKRGANGQRFTALYPDPADVFGGLARRWQSLDGPALSSDLEEFVRGGGCVVAGHDLHTETFRTSDRTQLGFVGCVSYECRGGTARHMIALNALARLAFWGGIGYQTARGMGAVRVDIVGEAQL